MKYLSRLLKKIKPSTKIKTFVDKTGKVEGGSYCINSSIGRYSYCGHGCTIINTEIGNFCSISDDVVLGNASHPLSWVSTSCAFYKGRDSIKKKLASLTYDGTPLKTTIGNDVWIGQRAIVKSGVTVGDGAIIGMGAIVTHDVPPYAVVAGIPAKVLRFRFDNQTIEKLLSSKWWYFSDEKIKSISSYCNNVDLFLKMINK